MGLFSKAKDNYDKRKDIAEFNYRTREYISEGERIYEKAYEELRVACNKSADKADKYVRYKQDVLNEINKIMKSIDSEHKNMSLSLKINIPNIEASGVVQNEKLGAIDKALATWVAPSVSDFFVNVSAMDYYEAKSEMNKAKSYRERMKMKRDELREAKYAVQKIPDFICEEQKQIDELMGKFRKTADAINNSDTAEKVESLNKIAKLIADLLTTQFIENNYEITAQYMTVYKRISEINNSLSGCAWLIGG